jgi:hypothetical protein
MATSEDLAQDASGAILAAANADLLVAADGALGLDNVARLYLSFPSMQDWIVTQLEQIDPQQQRQFLNRVRTLSQEGAS